MRIISCSVGILLVATPVSVFMGHVRLSKDKRRIVLKDCAVYLRIFFACESLCKIYSLFQEMEGKQGPQLLSELQAREESVTRDSMKFMTEDWDVDIKS